MQKVLFSFKKEIIGKLLRGLVNKQETVRLLGCIPRTVRNYLAKTAVGGLEKLDDQRHSNYHKLASKQVIDVVESKKTHPWRSARKTIEILNLPSISPRQIQRIWVKHQVSQLNIERLKPIKRFLAPYPNNLWQADIMGKIDFPFIGTAYLIANLDDHSRFILSAKWFSSQNKINVFRVWFYALYNRLAENPAIYGGDESKRLKLVRGVSDKKLRTWGFPQDSFKLAKKTPDFSPGKLIIGAYPRVCYKTEVVNIRPEIPRIRLITNFMPKP